MGNFQEKALYWFKPLWNVAWEFISYPNYISLKSLLKAKKSNKIIFIFAIGITLVLGQFYDVFFSFSCIYMGRYRYIDDLCIIVIYIIITIVSYFYAYFIWLKVQFCHETGHRVVVLLSLSLWVFHYYNLLDGIFSSTLWHCSYGNIWPLQGNLPYVVISRQTL